MLNALISFSLRNRFAVLLGAALLVYFGVDAAIKLPLDAFPDTTPIQVQINTTAPSLSPEEIELQITRPVELCLGGLKGLQEVRSVSKFGLSQVVAIYTDETDLYEARHELDMHLAEVELPPGVNRPTLGPVATGLGEVYHYFLTSKLRSLTELRTLQDWVVRPKLRLVPGVAEVNTLGGLSKQYEVRADPAKLAKYGLGLDDVFTALKDNNENMGGGPVERGGELTVVQGRGIVGSTEEIAGIVIKAVDGVPIRVRDVAEVDIGHAIRRGGTTAMGKGEVVLGLVFMRYGENSREVTNAVEEAMDEVRGLLPADVKVEVVYRRTDLIDHVIQTVEKNLSEGALLVIAVLFAFLGNLRAGLIVAMAIPFSMLFALTMMEKVGIAGSLMSLGAIDFGLIVDSSVVLVENCVRQIGHAPPGKPKLEIIREAAVEVRRPTMFGELIIMIVYLPILMLEGVEGKLFRPMALTVIFALLGSLVLSTTLMPALASIALPRKIRERETFVDRFAHWIFRPILHSALDHPILSLILVGSISVGAIVLGSRLGSEFIPKLNEGAIVFNTIRLASVNLDESQRYGSKIEKILLKTFPDEIDRVWTRTGTAEVATDPMGLEVSDVFVTLRPRERWKRAKDQDELTAEMTKVTAGLPGIQLIYTQPIEQRIGEMIAGIKSDVGIKLYGPDLAVLTKKSEEIAALMRTIPGTTEAVADQITGLPVLKVDVDRQALSRYGVSARQVLDLVGALGGISVGEVREGERRFPLVVRLPQPYRDDPESLKKILVTTVTGQRLPLTQLARLVPTVGASTINREGGNRRTLIQANVRGRDMLSYVEEVRRRIDSEVALPLGYSYKVGGEYEHLIRSERRLEIIVPVALGLALSLLYLTFKSLRDALMIFSGVLFARVGGVLGLYLTGQPFTVSAGVGFVALAGASILEGLILVSAIRDRMAHGVPKRQAIEQARLARLRPVLMTGLVASLGFVPMMLSTGIGAEVQRPLATVVVFGMACDTILTMLALPSLYLLFGKGPALGLPTAEPAANGDGSHGPGLSQGPADPV